MNQVFIRINLWNLLLIISSLLPLIKSNHDETVLKSSQSRDSLKINESDNTQEG